MAEVVAVAQVEQAVLTEPPGLLILVEEVAVVVELTRILVTAELVVPAL